MGGTRPRAPHRRGGALPKSSTRHRAGSTASHAPAPPSVLRSTRKGTSSTGTGRCGARRSPSTPAKVSSRSRVPARSSAWPQTTEETRRSSTGRRGRCRWGSRVRPRPRGASLWSPSPAPPPARACPLPREAPRSCWGDLLGVQAHRSLAATPPLGRVPSGPSAPHSVVRVTPLSATGLRGRARRSSGRARRPAKYRACQVPCGARMPSGWTLDPAGAQVSVDAQPDGAVLSPDGNSPYVPTSGQWSESLEVLDTSTLHGTAVPDASAFEGVAADGAGNIFVSAGTMPAPGYPANMVLAGHWLDAAGSLPLSSGTISQDDPAAAACAAALGGGTLGSCSVADAIGVSNPSSTTPIEHLIPVGEDAYGIALPAATGTLDVSSWADSTVFSRGHGGRDRLGGPSCGRRRRRQGDPGHPRWQPADGDRCVARRPYPRRGQLALGLGEPHQPRSRRLGNHGAHRACGPAAGRATRLSADSGGVQPVRQRGIRVDRRRSRGERGKHRIRARVGNARLPDGTDGRRRRPPAVVDGSRRGSVDACVLAGRLRRFLGGDEQPPLRRLRGAPVRRVPPRRDRPTAGQDRRLDARVSPWQAPGPPGERVRRDLRSVGHPQPRPARAGLRHRRQLLCRRGRVRDRPRHLDRRRDDPGHRAVHPRRQRLRLPGQPQRRSSRWDRLPADPPRPRGMERRPVRAHLRRRHQSGIADTGEQRALGHLGRAVELRLLRHEHRLSPHPEGWDLHIRRSRGQRLGHLGNCVAAAGVRQDRRPLRRPVGILPLPRRVAGDQAKYSVAGWTATYGACRAQGGSDVTCQESMPSLSILDLPDDHTNVANNGNNPLMWSPQVMAANNDLATGQVAQAL